MLKIHIKAHLRPSVRRYTIIRIDTNTFIPRRQRQRQRQKAIIIKVARTPSCLSDYLWRKLFLGATAAAACRRRLPPLRVLYQNKWQMVLAMEHLSAR